MRYASIRDLDISNGEGVGISLFVQGCHFHCKNCFNQETWDFHGGEEWTDEINNKFISLADKPYIKRISILGGEPLANENAQAVLSLLKNIRSIYHENKSIWMYTGYTFEDIYKPDNIRFEIINLIDVLIDGQYDESKKDYKYQWAGSTNQRVIDIRKTIANKGSIVYVKRDVDPE